MSVFKKQPLAGLLLSAQVLLVYGCVPTSKGQLLSYISWNFARVQH